LNPEFVVCDEPVSALDVSIQAQIINLLEELQDEFGLTYLFIAHDLAVVRHISDRIAVMYLGKVVEVAPAEDLYENPLHPYTIALLSAIPIPDPEVERTRETIRIYGDLPSPANPPDACRFHTRCPFVQETRCRDEEPLLRELEGHHVACHWAEDIKSGLIEPRSRVPVFDPGLQPAAWEPPPT
jgi:peptide/nickel transport system ATP-binding protein